MISLLLSKNFPRINPEWSDSNTAKAAVHYLTFGLNDIDALSHKLEPHFIQLHCFKQRKAELDPAINKPHLQNIHLSC